jgi:hypothetical protein
MVSTKDVAVGSSVIDGRGVREGAIVWVAKGLIVLMAFAEIFAVGLGGGGAA